MILTGQEIAERFPALPRDQINATSFDVRLQPTILTEARLPTCTIDVRNPSPQAFDEVTIRKEGRYIPPGQFFLGATTERIDLSNHRDLSAIFELKSSVGRMGLEHMKAGWIEPEFDGTITLELKNVLQHNTLRIYGNMPIGQIIFFKHAEVSPEFSYRKLGRYVGQTTPQRSKGVSQ